MKELHQKRAYGFLLALFALMLFAGCSRQQSRELFCMDTFVKLTATGRDAGRALDACERELLRLEALFSIANAESDTSRINRAGGAAVSVSADTARLLETAQSISERTGGAFDVTVYPLVDAWGFTGSVQRVPTQAELDALLPHIGMEKLHLLLPDAVCPEPGTQVDFGGIAKGYASARLAQIAGEYGLENALFTLGGNVQTVGSKQDGTMWRVGIMDPDDDSAVLGVLSVGECAVVTAGSYQRYFTENGVAYHHILDPKNGFPAASGLRSVTVVAGDGTAADALSTALFVMGEETAIALYRADSTFDMIIVTSEGRVLVTEGLDFSPEEGVNPIIIHE